LSNGTQIKYFIDNKNLKNIQSCTLRFQLQNNGTDSQVVPVPYWFDRIEIYDRFKGDLIARYYSDALFTMLNVIDQDKVEQWAKLGAYDSDNYGKDSKTHNATDTKYYYLPLVASVFEGMVLDMSSVNTELEIRMHPKSSGPFTNGSSSKLYEVAGLFDVECADKEGMKAHHKLVSTHFVHHHYLDVQQYIVPGEVLNASTQYEFDLDQFNHKSAALLCVIKPTGATNADNGRQQYMDLVDGSVDVIGVSGDSLYGHGRNVKADYLRYIIAPQFVGSKFFNQAAVYPIIFGDLGKALVGSVDGYHTFTGEKQRLQINTPALGSGSVVTITSNSIPDAGSYFVSYKGTVQRIPYDATTAGIEVYINGIPTIVKDDLKVTVVNSFDSGAPCTISIFTKTGQPAEDVVKYFNVWTDATTAGTPVQVTENLVDGTSGWINGTYDVFIYSLYFRDIAQHHKEFVVTDLK
jgi:hypothetical protein